MTKNTQSIASLQNALALEAWGLDKMAGKMHGQLQKQLGDASAFIERIIFLGGDPKVQAAKVPVHRAWLNLLERMGKPAYVARQMSAPGET